jgi:hypothetical protein
MRVGKMTVFLIWLTANISPLAISQLRNISEYDRDRINTEKTYFVLRDTGKAEFSWATEWTTSTAYAADGKSAILVWHFKDGSKAYSRHGQGIGEFGKSAGYSITDKSAKLEDIHGKPIQPLTRANYPVKIELWVGEIVDSTGYSLEAMGDEACFQSPGIEYNISYHFSGCKAGGKEMK